MIKFIKILEYEGSTKGEDRFDHYVRLGMQRIDPHTLCRGKLDISEPIVFHSTLARAVECLLHKPQTIYFPRTILGEVLFDIEKMCSRAEWEKEGSISIRRRFLESFINNTLPIKNERLFDDAKSILFECIKSEAKEIAVVSHSFRMKLIEAFVKTEGCLQADPGLLGDYLQEGERTFEFGGGFSVHKSELAFLMRLPRM